MDEGKLQIMGFPDKGLDLGSPVDSSEPGYTEEGVNVRAYEFLTERGRGGSRAGLVRYIKGPMGASPGVIQELNTVVSTSGDDPPSIADSTAQMAPLSSVGIDFNFHGWSWPGGWNWDTGLAGWGAGRTGGGGMQRSNPVADRHRKAPKRAGVVFNGSCTISPYYREVGTVTGSAPASVTIPNITVLQNEMLVVSVARHTGFDVGLTMAHGANPLLQDVSDDNGDFRGSMWSYAPAASTTGDLVVTLNSATGTIAVAAAVVGNLAFRQVDQTAVLTGSDDNPLSGGVITTFKHTVAVSTVSTRGPVVDSTGAWIGFVTESQRDGTNNFVPTSNSTVSTAYEILASIAFSTGEKQGIDARDWVAMTVSYK